MVSLSLLINSNVTIEIVEFAPIDGYSYYDGINGPGTSLGKPLFR
jgi:hypothetical protein